MSIAAVIAAAAIFVLPSILANSALAIPHTITTSISTR